MFLRTVWGTWGWPKRASDWRECLNSCRRYMSERSSLVGWVCLLWYITFVPANEISSTLLEKSSLVLLVQRVRTKLDMKTSLSKSIMKKQSIIAHLPSEHCQGWSINKLDWEVWVWTFAFQWLMKWPKLWSCALLNSLVTSCQSGSLGGSLQALCCCCSFK